MGLFGFLGKGKKQAKTAIAKETAPTEAAEVALSHVADAVNRELARKIAEEKKQADDLYRDISDGFGEIRKISAELTHKKFEAHEKIYAPVNMVKDNYARKALSLLGNPPAISAFNYSEVSGFCEGTGKILHELMHIPPKQAVLLSKYFRHETSRITKLLKETEETRKQLLSMLDGSALWLDGETKSRASKLLELDRRAKDFEAQASLLTEKIKNRKERIDAKAKELEAFFAGEKYRHYAELDGSIRSMEKERSDIGNRLNDELSGIKRPMKKLEHAAASGGEAMEKEKLSLYSDISHSPLKVLLQEQGDAKMMDALLRLRSLNLKSEEKVHVEELIKKIELNYLPELADKYRFLEGEISGKKAEFEVSDVPEKRSEAEREMESLKHEIAVMESELEKTAKSGKEIAYSIKIEKGHLEEFLASKINIRLRIAL